MLIIISAAVPGFGSQYILVSRRFDLGNNKYKTTSVKSVFLVHRCNTVDNSLLAQNMKESTNNENLHPPLSAPQPRCPLCCTLLENTLIRALLLFFEGSQLLLIFLAVL